ncbi:transient receptor potential cation channel family member painless [Xylocopa sonorina]|uniref:transient receptor potential cation channel family member painless n=1 Tax=Xylocopa sonorina TaxID=1818115 RepID=UPI00403B04D0
MTIQASRGTYVSDPDMHTEDENAEMYLLHESNPNCTNSQTMYKQLLEDLQKGNIGHFERCIEQRLEKQPPSIDLNYAYPDQSDQTLLHIACKEGREEFVKFLLRKGANVNKVNELYNRGPIHLATEHQRYKVLGILLDEPTIDPNLKAGGITALHIAVNNKDRMCAELLLEKGANPNIPNSRALTALRMAAIRKQKDMVNLIFEKSKHTLDLDSYSDNPTTRQVLQENMPDITLPPAVKRDVNVHDLKCYLYAKDEENFLKYLNEIQDDLRDDIVDMIETAVRKNFESSVRQLLNRAETVNCNLKKSASIAIQQGSPDILRQLLDKNIEDESDLLMDACVELGIPRKGASHGTNDRLECLKLLLERDVDVRCTDKKGNTPLHYAARAGCSEAVTLLLAKGSYIGQMNKFNVPPIADISASTISEYFDECIQVKKDLLNEYTIEFDYKCLIPHDTSYKENRQKNSINQGTGEMDIFQFIADKNGLRDLLTHPLLSSFLYLKWHRIRYILWLNSVFYVLFYLLLNSYILQMIYMKDSEMSRNSSVHTEIEIKGSSSVVFLWVATGLATALLAVREILQLISSPCHYLSSFENWIEMALIILGFAVWYDMNIQIAAVTILLSAWLLVTLFGKYPRTSIAIEMFKTVSINFIRFLVFYAILIVAFALAFFTLFKDADEEQNFLDFGHSLFKTIIMLTGELEANDIPFVSHPILSHLIFVFFVFLITVVLFNLLNGLAVSDTAHILHKAELFGLISRVQVLTYIESVAIGAPFVHGRHCIICNGLLHKWKCNPPAFFARKVLLFPSYLKSGKLSVKLHDSLEAYGNSLRYSAQTSENSKGKVLPNMDPQVKKRVNDILSRRNRETIEKKIINKLERLEERFVAIQTALDSIQRKLENNNVIVAGAQED